MFTILPIAGIYLFIYIISLWIFVMWLTFVGLQNFLKQNKPINLDYLWINRQINNQKTNVKNSECIPRLAADIDKHFIAQWFGYISNDQTFNKESRIILEEILKKLWNVQQKTDTKILTYGLLNLYLKHLKEYRRSLKRRTKYGGDLKDLYRYVYVDINSMKTREYFIHQLTITLMNNFINWELSNSLPCRILLAIIARKLTNHVLHLLSNPTFLNYHLLYSITPPEKRLELNLDKYDRIFITNLTDLVPEVKETKLEMRQEDKQMNEMKSEEVKIYEPKSCKTWRNTRDVASISFGQDIMDMLNTEMEKSQKYPEEKSFLDEVKQITSIEGIRTSIKPISEATAQTFHNIQETTVNNVSQATTTALHKFGDFQDEAVGVVGGILDFGKARIKEGLRLTRLQDPNLDGANDKSTTRPIRKNITKAPHVEEESETVWMNPLQENLPTITHSHDSSPDPEYEENADLATTIAKLRYLLEQKSSESNLSTPSLSPMPVDEYQKIENFDTDETDGVSFYKLCAKTATGVISNTLKNIKTALPGNATDFAYTDSTGRWIFIEAPSTENDFMTRMNKLLSERKVFCTIETAYEAIDSLVSPETVKEESCQMKFEDELNDFELKLPIAKVLLDVFCELLGDVKDSPFRQEPIIKSILLLFGNQIEDNVNYHVDNYIDLICNNVKIPSESRCAVLNIDLESFINALTTGIPNYIKFMFGEKTLTQMLQLFIESYQTEKINQDIIMQMCEFICMKLIDNELNGGL